MNASHTSKRPRRPRWYKLYFVLAAFDLMTISFSLYLNHNLMTIYAESIRVNQEWAARLGRYAEIGQLAAAVNAPGNDVFDSQDVEVESGRLVKALTAFKRELAAAQDELPAKIIPTVVEPLLKDFEEIGRAMDEMVAEAELIFGYFRSSQPRKAGERMATMDRKYAILNRAFAELSRHVRDIQQQHFAEQQAAAAELRRYEYVIAACIAMMVMAVTLYGHKMAKAMAAAEQDRERYLEALREAHDELERRVMARTVELSSSNQALTQEIIEHRASEERLQFLANYDTLTGLANRNLLLEHLRQAMTRLPWSGQKAAILYCDLDRFKLINDTLGHSIGDTLLQRVGERLKGCVRAGDVVARMGGDEFVVLLTQVAHSDDVLPIVSKILAVMAQSVEVGQHELFVTTSIGISVAPSDGDNAEELLKNADIAMYAAKREGRNSYYFYSREMSEQTQERMKLEAALRRALIEDSQLEVYYQPQKGMDGQLLGFEALVRWHEPQLGLISPAHFLPAAEEAGLMSAIDEWVLKAVCRQLSAWRSDGWGDFRVAVNISDHLFKQGNLPDLVARMLAEYGLPASALELELTEAIVMKDIEASLATMQALCDLGVDLAIDDFGTGYSSLGQLKRCPITTIKVDRSFIRDITTDPNDAAITEAIVVMAHKMGIKVLAEGVETVEQSQVLRNCGCDSIQGYLLSRPVSSEQVPELMRRLCDSQRRTGNSTRFSYGQWTCAESLSSDEVEREWRAGAQEGEFETVMGR